MSLTLQNNKNSIKNTYILVHLNENEFKILIKQLCLTPNYFVNVFIWLLLFKWILFSIWFRNKNWKFELKMLSFSINTNRSYILTKNVPIYALSCSLLFTFTGLIFLMSLLSHVWPKQLYFITLWCLNVRRQWRPNLKQENFKII